MSMPTTTIGNYPTIEEELSGLQDHAINYRAAINQEGIWLFLATLGCWGVSNLVLQYFAYLIVGLLFGERLDNRTKEKASVAELVKRVEQRIRETVPEGDIRKARLYDLANLQQTELSKVTSLKKAKVFLICWAFYGASVLYLTFSKLV